MTTETAETEGEGCGETGGFKTKDKDETGDTARSVGLRGGENKEPGEKEVDGKNIPRLDGFESHDATGYETVEGVETLGCGEYVG